MEVLPPGLPGRRSQLTGFYLFDGFIVHWRDTRDLSESGRADVPSNLYAPPWCESTMNAPVPVPWIPEVNRHGSGLVTMVIESIP